MTHADASIGIVFFFLFLITLWFVAVWWLIDVGQRREAELEAAAAAMAVPMVAPATPPLAIHMAAVRWPRPRDGQREGQPRDSPVHFDQEQQRPEQPQPLPLVHPPPPPAAPVAVPVSVAWPHAHRFPPSPAQLQSALHRSHRSPQADCAMCQAEGAPIHAPPHRPLPATRAAGDDASAAGAAGAAGPAAAPPPLNPRLTPAGPADGHCPDHDAEWPPSPSASPSVDAIRRFSATPPPPPPPPEGKSSPTADSLSSRCSLDSLAQPPLPPLPPPLPAPRHTALLTSPPSREQAQPLGESASDAAIAQLIQRRSLRPVTKSAELQHQPSCEEEEKKQQHVVASSPVCRAQPFTRVSSS